MYGCTSLHVAVLTDANDVAEYLIKESLVSVEAKTKSSLTPLQIAAYFDSSKCAELLLGSGAIITCRNPSAYKVALVQKSDRVTDILERVILENNSSLMDQTISDTGALAEMKQFDVKVIKKFHLKNGRTEKVAPSTITQVKAERRRQSTSKDRTPSRKTRKTSYLNIATVPGSKRRRGFSSSSPEVKKKSKQPSEENVNSKNSRTKSKIEKDERERAQKKNESSS